MTFFMKIMTSLLSFFLTSAALAGVNNIYCESQPPHAKVILVGQMVQQNRLLLSAGTDDDNRLNQYLNQPFGLKGFSKDGRFAIYLGGNANKFNSNLAFILDQRALSEPGRNFQAIYKWSEIGGENRKNYEVYLTCLRK